MQRERLVQSIVTLSICASSVSAMASTDQVPFERQPPAYEIRADRDVLPRLSDPRASPPPRKNLFGRLFEVPGTAKARRSTGETKPKVVCGMTIMPGDPNTDPGIHRNAPESETTFTIRAVQPPVCWPE